MLNWLERLISGTRLRLLGLLRRSDRTVSELAELVGISGNAVRTHLASLHRDGMVEEAGVVRDTGGKPAQVYRMSPQAEELFPKAYATVLLALLRVLEERDGRDATRTLLREVGARAAPPVGREQASLEARVQAAAAALRGLGGEVEVEAEGEHWRLRGHGCPLAAVVREHHDACTLAEELVAEVTQARVTECCTRGERPRCGFRVAPADSAAAAGAR